MLQIVFYGVSIIWVCSMIAFSSIYINIQNAEISTGHLTGLYNRRRLDQHFQRKLKLRRNHQFFAMMLDLDDIKKINDRYGHETGDDALISACTWINWSVSAPRADLRHTGTIRLSRDLDVFLSCAYTLNQ